MSNGTSTLDILARKRQRLRELIAERCELTRDLAAVDQALEVISGQRPLLSGDVEAFDRAIDALGRDEVTR